VIRWQGQASLSMEEALARLSLQPHDLHPDEQEAAARIARPAPGLAVRLLAKDLLARALADLELACPPVAMAILPFGAPPGVRLPFDMPPGVTLHLSLSHSAEQVMAFVVLWQDDEPDKSATPDPGCPPES
jgi:phosphopantetheinyl transferase (holo-ACP synthase)